MEGTRIKSSSRSGKLGVLNDDDDDGDSNDDDDGISLFCVYFNWSLTSQQC